MSVGIVDKQTGDSIPTAGTPAIDDALNLTSVNPVQNAVITAALSDKQDKTDNNLDTDAKTIVGAINEHEGDIDSLKSGLMNKEPLGGATTGNKTFKVGGNLELRSDDEGGNINIKSEENVQFEIDAHENILRVWSDKSGSYKFLIWDGNEDIDLNSLASNLTDLEKTTGIFSNAIVLPNDSVEVTLINSGALETYMLYTYGDSRQYATVTYLTYNYQGIYEATPIVSNTGITITGSLPGNKIKITNNTSFNCVYKIKKM